MKSSEGRNERKLRKKMKERKKRIKKAEKKKQKLLTEIKIENELKELQEETDQGGGNKKEKTRIKRSQGKCMEKMEREK